MIWSTLIIVAFFWALARWAWIVADKVPVWLHAQWKAEATHFLAEHKDNLDVVHPATDHAHEIQNPQATADSDVVVAPYPTWKWWTPVKAPGVAHQHKAWWVPFVGPYLDKKWRGSWAEVWIVLLCVAQMGVLFASSSVPAVPKAALAGRLLGGLLFIPWLHALSHVDRRTQLLPDIMVYPLLWLGLLWSVVVPGIVTPAQAVQGAVLGFGMPWMLSQLFTLVRRKEGMGGGDFKLLAAIGAWIGPAGVVIVLVAASFIALGQAIVLAVQRKPFNQFAFGPSLALAGVLMYIWFPLLYAAALQAGVSLQ